MGVARKLEVVEASNWMKRNIDFELVEEGE